MVVESDQSGGVVPGTIRTSQEVVYEKVVRKFMRSDRISWMEVILQVTDAGAGAWYGTYVASDAAGFMDVLKEFSGRWAPSY